MNNKLPPQEPMVIIPIGMVINPCGTSLDEIKTLDQVIQDFVTTGRGITRIDPTDFYKEDHDNG